MSYRLHASPISGLYKESCGCAGTGTCYVRLTIVLPTSVCSPLLSQRMLLGFVLDILRWHLLQRALTPFSP